MYKVAVIDCFEREAFIEAQIKASKVTDQILFKYQLREFPVIRIPIGVPVYRVKNGRTQVEQKLYILDKDIPEDYFISGEENSSVQAVQHNILLNLAKDNKGSIYKELENVRVQTERLIITSKGVIVNGNRRLAAMRELYDSDPSLFSQFSYVDVIVLSEEATNIEIEILEAQLQLKPETKLEYSWIDRLLKIRYQVYDLKIPRDDIMKAYRFRRDFEITEEINLLNLVEEYLEKYIEKPYAYNEVMKSEQIFKELQRSLTNNIEKDEIRKELGFLFIKESKNLEGRVYNIRQMFGTYLEKVLERYADEENIVLDETLDDQEDTTDDININDPLEGLDTLVKSRYTPIKEILSDKTSTTENAEKLVRIYNSVKNEQKQGNVRLIGINNAKDALRLLNDIDLTKSDPSTYKQIEGQLSAIIKISKKLLNDLGSMPNNSKEG